MAKNYSTYTWKTAVQRIVTAQLAAGDAIAVARQKAVDVVCKRGRHLRGTEVARYAGTLEA